MRAAIFREFGPANVLEVAEMPMPKIGSKDVLVRVYASAVQPFDVAARAGWMPSTAEVRLPVITGNEFAGEIVAMGADVDGFTVGDRVSGRHTFGCAAEYLSVPATDIARIAPNLSFAQAAYLGGTGQTAHMAVEFLKVRSGDTFLIHGGSGGVGSIAVQLGVLAGARVLATGSARNQGYLRALGAEAIIYGEGLKDRIEAAAPESVSVVLDCAGGEALDITIALGTDKARIATIRDYKRYKELGVQWPVGERNGTRLAKLMELAAAGELIVHIRKTYPLEAIAEAHREVETGHGPGKIAVLIP
ncbi:NADP-dependent oxidoreductase [Pelagibacterium lentulum]|uniref:Oxidoreductase n=1 Tax=Pelagibacterium lentulum TaxID=2029865 RepID=A0A916R9T8_9HYPH|nr:NADP-dependent oxidoreductase [Pelagibacterium lentulum]GGA40271.1 oxidoreductase [Pelagibacterium lentulum]